jgi:hypothetical protein
MHQWCERALRSLSVELMLLLPAVSYAAKTAEAAAAAGTLAAGLTPMIGAAMTLFQKKRLSARAAMLLEALDGLASTSASAWQSTKTAAAAAAAA